MSGNITQLDTTEDRVHKLVHDPDGYGHEWQVQAIIQEVGYIEVQGTEPNHIQPQNGSYPNETVGTSRPMQQTATKFLMYKRVSDELVSLHTQIGELSTEKDVLASSLVEAETKAQGFKKDAERALQNLERVTEERDQALKCSTEFENRADHLKERDEGNTKDMKMLVEYFGTEKLAMVLGLEDVDDEVKRPAWMK